MKKIVIIVISCILLIASGLILYNYKLVNEIEIKLVSREKITLNVHDIWNDPGYIVSNKDYQDKVIVNSNLDVNKEGVYKIEYYLKVGLFSKSTIREINVLSSEKTSDITMQFNGDNPYYLMNGGDYVEQGIKVTDTYEGDLSNKVKISSNILSTQNGEYEVNYEVTSSSGITKKIQRKVVVYSFDFVGEVRSEYYSQENEIIIKINDEHYSYTILPNKSKTINKNITYEVTENGLYEFVFYDTNNNSFKYEANVTNIDREKPTGTCTLTLADKNGTIVVNAKDNNELNGYEYLYGNNKSGRVYDSKYTINTLDEEASVVIYDKANNSNTVKCNTVDNSTKISRSYKLKKYVYNGKEYKYWFYTPKDNTARKNMPLLVYFHGDGGRPNPDGVNKYALPKNINEGTDYPFYMIAPYCNNEVDFSHDEYMKFVISLINSISKKYNIDTDRIIMSGGSSGARGAYAITAKYKKKFSCLVIISGITYQLAEKEKDLTYLPIWVFHGKKDAVVNYSDVKRHVDNINSYGGNVKLTTYDGGHDSTDQAFKTKSVIEWIVSQRRKG